ncbi:hypothetical protein LNV08_14275 [Paucibacter sp. TC2R-5]|uniref:hypothetical protein n=1 Tax=Paucibacter sp. TC2R-5 TaxID=2893555 RepID=UPI0021E38EDA|nr:hypothetical protein [Paucibacter sp. TC2R-5]MCV2360142.1 hypothetical protein [Paucibacter sp. TC2R-5]
MNVLAIAIALLAATVLYVAYIEFKAKNHRDGRLLAGIGASSAIAGAGLFLL